MLVILAGYFEARTGLPRVEGEAGWPWVRANMATGFQTWALAERSATVSCRAGSMTVRQASFRERGTAVLLMSCEVRPKWINSL